MQTQQEQQQSAIMQVPPQVITTKDSQYLKDQLSWELLAMKKCRGRSRRRSRHRCP